VETLQSLFPSARPAPALTKAELTRPCPGLSEAVERFVSLAAKPSSDPETTFHSVVSGIHALYTASPRPARRDFVAPPGNR